MSVSQTVEFHRPVTQSLDNILQHIYDPEGALATLPTVMSVWLGVHFGRALRAEGLANRPKHILLQALDVFGYSVGKQTS